jgi:hypothetical protein
LEVTELGAITSRGATLTARNNGYQLAIPGLGIDVVLPGNGSSVPVSGVSPVLANISGSLRLGVATDSYFGGGLWFFQPSDANSASVLAPFIFGYRTPPGTFPRIGTAIYSAIGGLIGIVFVRSNSGGIGAADLEGDVSLTANFANSRITGTATNIIATDSENRTSNWNGFSIDASIRGSDPKDFEGSTITSSAPATTYALQSGAAGRVGGYLFGPSMETIGAVWSLGNSDNSGAAYGLIGADRAGGNVIPLSAQYLSFLLPHFNWTNGGVPSIPAPQPATKDAASTPSLFATPGGRTLDNSVAPLFEPNVSPLVDAWFPIWVSGLRFSATEILPFTNGAGARFTVSNPGNRIWLVIPALDMDSSIDIVPGKKISDPASSANQGTGAGFVNYGLSYTGLGAWSRVNSGTGVQTSAGFFSYGFETPAGAMPGTGTASYSQTGGAAATAFIPSGTNVVEATVSGDASLSVNFSNGTIGGTLTNMSAYSSGASTAWNDVSVSASINAGTNRFSGSTSATSAPNGAFALKGNATGHINGNFNGPSADELGAVWTLSNGDGTGSAVGVVGARRP